jgi:hypothetical protein
MAYMTADTGNKVGFRPYGSTNPQCAATLSGLGQNHPFKPEAWHLHPAGMGDYEFNRPMDPWELFPPHSGLHGLAGLGDGSECVYFQADGTTVESVDPNSNPTECATNGGVWEIPPGATVLPVAVAAPVAAAPAAASGIPAGSVFNFQCTFTPTSNPLSASFYSVSNVISAVAAYLQSQWGITVTSSSGSGTLTGTPTATLKIQTSQSYSQLSDLQSILTGSFYNAAGAQVMAVQQLAMVSTPATSQALIQQLATAQAAGDTPTANAIMSLLNAGGVTGASASSIETFLVNNAMWIGIGLLAMVALPPLIKKL